MMAATSQEQVERIFVSIPSYRDPECQYTVLDLFKKAKHPGRVYIGICWQADREEDASCFLLEPPADLAANVRTHFLHHSEARGPCYARALIEQKLFDGEEFFLQLDSHYRMIDAWDEELIQQLKRCPSDKPILTTYPSSYTLPDDYRPGGPDNARLNPGPAHPIAICAREFGSADGFLRTVGKQCDATVTGDRPFSALFWAAGFAFSASRVLREVPYDVGLEDLFFGEESSMAVRLWTSGWDFFSPTIVIGYHLWTRKHRPVFREHACPEQKAREARSQARVKRLLEGGGQADAISSAGKGGYNAANSTDTCANDSYGIGSVRTLADYEKASGLSFSQRRLSARAKRGGLDAAAFIGGDPAEAGAPALSSAAVPKALAVALNNPMLGLMPDKVASSIQALLGSSMVDAGSASGSTDAVALAMSAMARPAPAPLPLEPAATFEPADDGSRWQLSLLRREELEAVNKNGFVVIDRFLAVRGYSDQCGSTAAHFAPLIAHAGAKQVPLRPARLGRDDRIWSSTEVRGDEMAWLSLPQGSDLMPRVEARVRRGIAETDAPEDVHLTKRVSSSSERVSSDAAEQDAPTNAAFYNELDVVLAKFVQLRAEVDTVLKPATSRMSVMLARYPGGGARYAKHRDALPEHVGARRVTMIYYLNPNWDSSHGGCLRVHLPEAVAKRVDGARVVEPDASPAQWVLDIEPRMDRVVIFNSAWLEHEVLPTQSERFTLTGWLY
eukprot:TRINITY_DN28193_c0_g1_i1.p1 TRINITY_DN28193_c0_g1~~TRINITY_DN28193_c0_g1_i1.p1  ORF type:complete len:730 (-),score=95.63 TRINITY_DN28193_c0_g1_i1:98-2287(-)